METKINHNNTKRVSTTPYQRSETITNSADGKVIQPFNFELVRSNTSQYRLQSGGNTSSSNFLKTPLSFEDIKPNFIDKCSLKQEHSGTHVWHSMSSSCSKTTTDALLVSGGTKNLTRVHPSKATHKDHRTAERILRRLATSPITEDQVTKEDYAKILEDIQWAKLVIPNFDIHLYQKITSSNYDKSKRETLTMLSEQAKTQKAQSWLFSNIARNKRIIAVIDENSEEGNIFRHRWKWILAALTKVALQVIRENPGPPPICADAGWFNGNVKLIACHNNRSAKLYKAAINKIGEVYPGARLKVVEADEIMSCPRAKARIPVTPDDYSEIMQMLKEFNPEIPTNNWKIIKTKKPEKKNQATMLVDLLLNKKCLEVLAKREYIMNYGFGKINLKVYNLDNNPLDDLAYCNEIIEPPSDNETDIDDYNTN